MSPNLLLRIARTALAALLVLLVAWGAAMALFPIRPFWIDEWRLIANLKLKSAAALWGPLDYTQQFPRVYLQSLKAVTVAFGYSYRSLRLPALAVSLASLALALHLSKRIFGDSVRRVLFVLLFVSAQTYIDYLVQAKHYEMELLLSLAALWQLLALRSRTLGRAGFAGLCVTLLVAPFFSYTYPILVAPLWTTILFGGARNRARTAYVLPLLCSIVGVALFYWIDVRQVMADPQMSSYWQYRTIRAGGVGAALANSWGFFAHLGSGALFEVLLGFAGLCGFTYGCAAVVQKKYTGLRSDLNQFACGTVLVSFALFLLGKLPLGEAKFTAFTLPACALLILYLSESIDCAGWRKTIRGAYSIVLLGLAGNIVSTVVNTFTAPEYARRMRIYRATETAVRAAQQERLPIAVTPGVAWPDEITRTDPRLMTITADVVLKTFPAYDPHQALPVRAIDSLSALPAGLARPCMVGDGMAYRVLPATQ